MEALIIGAGGHASKVLGHLKTKKDIKVLGLISTETAGSVIHNYTVLGSMQELSSLSSSLPKEVKFHIGIGTPHVRYNLEAELKSIYSEASFFSVVAESAYLAQSSFIGDGTYIGAKAVVEQYVSLGRHVIIDSSAVIEHHCIVGDFCNISPGAVLCGGVTLGQFATIGAGATVIEKCKIGEGALIAAGAVVISDVPDYAVMVGVPAKAIKKRSWNEPIYR